MIKKLPIVVFLYEYVSRFRSRSLNEWYLLYQLVRRHVDSRGPLALSSFSSQAETMQSFLCCEGEFSIGTKTCGSNEIDVLYSRQPVVTESRTERLCSLYHSFSWLLSFLYVCFLVLPLVPFESTCFFFSFLSFIPFSYPAGEHMCVHTFPYLCMTGPLCFHELLFLFSCFFS